MHYRVLRSLFTSHTHTLTTENHLDTYFDSISNTYLPGKICTLCECKKKNEKKNLANILTVVLTKSTTTTMMMTNNILLTSFHFVPTINLRVCVFQIYKPLFDWNIASTNKINMWDERIIHKKRCLRFSNRNM